MRDKATKRNRRGALVVLCSFALAGLAIPSGLELAVADGNNVISCADLVFGTTASSSGNQVSPSDSTDYSSIYSSNVVSGLGATGWIGKTSGLSYALRIGSASSKSSSFTANFSSALNLDGVYAYCGKYASGDTANLTASTPGQTLSSTSLSAFYSDSTIDISSLDKALYFPLSGAASLSLLPRQAALLPRKAPLRPLPLLAAHPQFITAWPPRKSRPPRALLSMTSAFRAAPIMGSSPRPSTKIRIISNPPTWLSISSIMGPIPKTIFSGIPAKARLSPMGPAAVAPINTLSGVIRVRTITRPI